MYSSVSTHMQQQLVCRHTFSINIKQNVFRNALSHVPMRLQNLFFVLCGYLVARLDTKMGKRSDLSFFFFTTLAADAAVRSQKLFAIAAHLLLTTLLLYRRRRI